MVPDKSLHPIDLESLDDKRLFTFSLNGILKAISVGEIKQIIRSRTDISEGQQKKVNKAKSAGTHLRYLLEAQTRGDVQEESYHRSICHDLMGVEWTNEKLRTAQLKNTNRAQRKRAS